MTAPPPRSSAWSQAIDLAERTPESRNRYVDFLRACSIIVVVLGHWLMAAPSRGKQGLTLSDMLHVEPWTQWLTWIFMVMPLFFLVGGYSNAASWGAARRGGRSYGSWIAARLRRLVGPVVPFLVVWAALAIAAKQIGVKPATVQIGSQAALIPTWFLAVYVGVVVVVPVTWALWSRLGMASFWALALGAAAADALAFAGDIPAARWANYAFVWLGIHQLGYAWHARRIGGGARALAWSAAGLAVLVFLVTAGGYPLSMLTVPGEEVSNSRPPTLALLSLGVLHGGLALALEGPARRWLQNVRPWAATVFVNATIMTLFLWHATVLVLLVGLANWLGGLGLGYEPGTGPWWIARIPWLATCALVLLPFIAVFGRFEQESRRGVRAELPAWQALGGAAAVCGGLAALALGGIGASGPLGIRVWIVLLALAGAKLATGPSLRLELARG